MKISLGPAGIPTVSKDRTTEGGIKTVKELKLQAMEVEFVRNVYLTNEAAKKTGEAAKYYGIELSVHAPYFVNLCNPQKQKVSIWRIMQSVERAAYMGANVVVFHPGFYGSLAKERACEIVRKAAKQMSEAIRNKKWDVNLGLETTGKHVQFGTLDEIIQVCREVKNCVPVVDFAHIYARNGGKINYGEIFDKLEELELKHVHCHFTGVEFSDKGERFHLTIDRKKPDFEPLAGEILGRKMDITIISESPVLEQDSLVMKKVFEGMGYRF